MNALLTMGVDAWGTLILVGFATWTMARERLAPDIVMFGTLSLLVVSGILTPADGLMGFSNPAVATIGALFVCAAAIQETGALSLLSKLIFGQERRPAFSLARLIFPTTVMSAFMNNTPIVAMFIPMVRTHAQRLGMPASKFLIPLAYAAMLGGTCTVIGTSANLVVSGLLEANGYTPLGMLEIGWVGLPVSVAGLIYLMTAGRALLPDRQDAASSAQADAREYLAEAQIAPDAPLIGLTVEGAGLRSLQGLYLIEIRRTDGQVVRPVAPQTRLEPKDKLIFTGIANAVQDLLSQFPGLVAVTDDDLDKDRFLFEVVVSHQSELIGIPVREANFRRRFDAAILAVHRAGRRLEVKIGDLTLEPGDTLMLSASPGFGQTWRSSTDFYLVSDLRSDPPAKYGKANLALVTMLAMVLVPATTSVSMLQSAMGAVVLLFATGCISPQGARAAINWNVLVLIGSALGVAQALELSGAASALGQTLLTFTEPFGPRATLAGVYLLGVVFASFISNAAAAALVFPVAVTAAVSGGLDPRPFTIALALAASAGFSTPIGCQPNLLVYGPGGYRYLDFTRVGLPLTCLCLVITITILPMYWPLTG